MRRSWLIYLLTFSLAVNGATAAASIFFWLQNQTFAAASTGQKSVKSFLQEDLNYTHDQVSPIMARVDQSKQEVLELKAQMESQRAELMKLIFSVPVSADAVSMKTDEISRIQSQIRSIAVNTVIEILKSLPSESRDKFGAYLQARGRACDVLSPGNSGAGK